MCGKADELAGAVLVTVSVLCFIVTTALTMGKKVLVFFFSYVSTVALHSRRKRTKH